MSEFTIRLVMENGKTVEFSGPADITHETTDAIMNAANSSLLGLAHRVKTIRFVLFDAGTLKAYARAAEDFVRSHPASPFRIEKAPS